MFVLFNYTLTVLIWGSTWFVITYQLGSAAVEVSVALRFLIAALVLFAIGLAQGRRMTISARHYPWVVLQGLLLFSLNYLFVYLGTKHITSGLVAVLFTAIAPLNMIHERLLFRTRINGGAFAPVLLGVVGIALVFWPEITSTEFNRETLIGIGMLLIAVWSASLGNMTALRNTKTGLPVLAINAHGMLWGSLISFLAAVVLGRSFAIDWNFDYVWSLLYLSVFGSAIAFGCYLFLIERIGSGRAAYTNMAYPIVALLISTVFEDYRWSWVAGLGVALTLAGNALVLSTRSRSSVQTNTSD